MRVPVCIAAFVLAFAVVIFIHNTPARMTAGLVAVLAVLLVGAGAGHVDRDTAENTDE